MSRSSYRKRNALIISCFVALFLLNGMPGFQALTAQAAVATVSGTVFQDYNANGVRDTTPSNDTGVAAVTVTVYDAAGTSVGSATTAANGTYTITTPNSSVAPYRVEFTGIPAGFYPTQRGADNGTTVQFVAAGTTTNVSLGINRPTLYCQNNPTLATSCYVQGNQSGNDPVVVDFPYDAGSTDLTSAVDSRFDNPTTHNVMVPASVAGTTYGLAFQRSSKKLFVGASMRRHTGFAPSGGTGTIYQIDVSSGSATTASVFYTVPNAGPNTHDTANYVTDYTTVSGLNTWDAVGKTALGDIDMSEDDQTLYVMNLYDRSLYVVPVANPSVATAHVIPTSLPGATQGCNANDVRPYGLGVRNGLVYIGIVCTAQTSTNTGNLRAYIYTFNPSTTTYSAAPVLEFALNFARGCAEGTGCGSPNNMTAAWRTWKTTWAAETRTSGAFSGNLLAVHPQPMLSDIEFDSDGSMILGFRDRFGDQVGFQQYSNPGSPSQLYIGISAGDIMRACAVGNSWAAPGSTGCPNKSNTNQGPGGGEYYYEDNLGGNHDELSLGGLVHVPGRPDVLNTVFDPIPFTSEIVDGGVRWFSNSTGQTTRAYRLYDSNTNPTTLGKANGLGDLEALCNAAPIEVGNRVWNDANGNGIQDAGEPGIAGVTVQLYDNAGTLVPGATVTTDANGNYLFSSAAAGTGNAVYGLNIQPNTIYSIRIDNAADYTGAGPLAGLRPTKKDNDPSANGDSRDSDATISSATDTRIDLTTGAAGANNHTYDIGFTPSYSLGNRVWNDTDNNGTINGTETGIPGVTLSLFADANADGTPDNATVLGTATTDLNGYYRFDNLFAGTYVVKVDATNFASGQPLAGKASSTPTEATPNSDVDSNDNGINNANPATNGILSGPVTLGPGTSEPTGETDLGPGGQGAADNLANMTVDFGFSSTYSLGNRVWYDTDNSGTINGSEVGVDGVTVQLYAADGGGNPTGAALGTDLTDNGGSYLFTGLSAGDYVVVIPASNFGSGAVLERYWSSGTTTAGETAAPDPDADATDSDDNGTLQTGGAFSGAVLSKAVTLGGAEPTGEPPTPGRPDTTPDAQANYTVDFGFYTMSVGNFVWIDANNNGIFDGAESGLNGVAVRLYTSSGTLVASTTTAGGGLYSFDGLAAGDYIVQIDLPANYVSSTGTNGSATGPYEPAPGPDNDVDNDDNGSTSGGITQSATFTLTPGGEPTITNPIGKTANSTVDFGLFQPLALGNRVWNDANNDGLLNGAEIGIGGVTVNLYAANGSTLIATTTTDGNGYYLFTGLAAGDYIVEVVPPAGYRSSTGANGSATGPYEGAATPDPDTNIDSDDNGSTAGAVIRSALVTLTAGSEPTGEQNGGGDTTLDANSNLTVDFGLFQPFSLGNRVWEDTDNSGAINGSETIGSIGPLTVRLYASDGTTLINSTTTDATGYYRFDNLAAGDYIVQMDIPAGYASSTGAGQEANPNSDGDSNDNGVTAAGASIRSGLVTLGSDAAPVEPTGETDLGPGGQGAADNRANMTVDFGFFRLLSLGDLVWNDSNNDGLFNGAETGVNGVVVELYTDTNGNGSFDVADTLVTSQTTVNGAYLFTGLQPGEYIVVLPASNFNAGGQLEDYSSSTGAGSGYEPAPDPDGDVNNDDNGSVIGTLGSGGVIASNAVTLAPGTEPTNDGDTNANSNLSVDFGVFNLASIGDFVWDDTNFDGVFDIGEIGKNGVTVTLYQPGPDGIAGTADDVQIGTTTTSNGGAYSFTGLQPGDYFVTFSGLPSGYVFSPQDQGGNDATDSDADITTGRTIITTLTPGENDPTWDAGIYQLAGLGDFVWEDLDRDGVQDPSEPGIGGVTVNLLDGSGNFITTTTTLGDGSYFFGGLTPGVPYQVEFVPPAGYLFTLVDQGGDDAFDSDAATTTGLTPQVTLGAGESNPTLDAGLYQTASLGDFVWYDTNVNGVLDGGETGVENVTVNLYSPGYGPDGIPNNVDDALVVATTTTDNIGFYQFTGLTPGVPYQVEVVKPAGYVFSPQDAVAATDATDSDVDRTTGRTPAVTLQSGENNPTLDAGIYQLASIGDLVWFDANGNGVRDIGEAGVPNVSVELFTGAGVSVGTTTTDANGNYSFDNLQPGDYYVVVSLPSGYVFSPQDQGGDDAADSDADTTTGQMITTTLVPGENDLTWDAGIYQLVSLGNLVWNDINNNGVVDGGETGFGGVTVNLYASNGTTLINSTTTLADGTYLFQNLVPGDYIVALPASNFAAGGPLEGYRSSTGTNGSATGPNEAAPDPDNDVDSDDNGSAANGAVASGIITLLSGGEPTAEDGDANSNLTVDFGLFLPASLGSIVWQDDNGDGQRDPAEPGVGGVTVTLYDQNGNVVATTTTDANGNFLFENLVPGTYTVGFSDLPPNYVFTTPNQGSDVTDSDVDPNTGLTGSVTLVPGQNDLTVNAGIVPSSPTAIQILSFVATRTKGDVAVHWQTGAEVNTLGFHLFRSTTGQRADAERITPQLIAAKGRGGDGASYTWLDTTAQPAVNYTYWLEETEANGSTREYGPVRVGGASVQMKNRVFIPLITR